MSYPIKAAIAGVSVSPFFLIQKNKNEKRYIAWINDKYKIRILIAGFINKANSNLNVKIVNFYDEVEGETYHGNVSKSDLHIKMSEFEEVIFHNGYHDFMVMNPDTKDYIVFDDHGLIFIYTNEDYTEIFKNLDVNFDASAKLTYEFDHFHYIIPEGNNKLLKFINELKLKET